MRESWKSNRTDGESTKISNFRESLPQILAVSVKNVLLLAFGMTLGFPTIVIPAIQGGEGRDETIHDDIVLNAEQISWFSSINLICVPLGCIFSGTFTQRIGRRRGMQLVNIPILISWLLFHYSTNIYYLYAAMCFSGIAGGLSEAPVLTYVAEVTTPKMRGMLAATGSSCVIIGVFSQFLMGTFMKWRQMALVNSAVPIISIALLFFVPDSPHWLIKKKRFEDAKRAFQWLRGWTKFDKVKDEYEAVHDMLTKKQIDSTLTAKEKSWRDVLVPYYDKSFIQPFLIITWCFFVGHFSGMTTLQTFAVQIFHTLKAPIDKYYATMILGILELAGTIACVILVKFTGKRPLVFMSTIGMGICFFGTATYAYFLDAIPGTPPINNIVANLSMVPQLNIIPLPVRPSTTTESPTTIASDQEISTILNSLDLQETTTTIPKEILPEVVVSSWEFSRNEINITVDDYLRGATDGDIFVGEKNKFVWIPLILLLGSAFLSHAGIKIIPWMLIGELFPSNVRAISSGISGGNGYIFGFLANKLFLGMIRDLTLAGTFWFYSCVSLFGALLLYFVLPETEGHSLLEIENHFRGIKKLPRGKFSSKRKKVSSTTQTPKFELDLENWESNEIFEKYLQKINQEKPQCTHYCPKHNKMGVKKHASSVGIKVESPRIPDTDGIDNPAFSFKNEITHL